MTQGSIAINQREKVVKKKYKIRYPILFLTIYFYTFVFGSIALFCSVFDPTGNVVHFFSKLWSKAILYTSGVKVHVRGLDNIDSSKTYVFMSNHQSLFDIPAIFGYLPVQFRVIAKESLFKIPFMGWSMKRAGYIGINRSSPKKALRSLNEAAEKVRTGTSVLVFAEGTRSADGNVQKFKSGGCQLAIQAQTPIVPISISGSREVIPRGSLCVDRGEIYVTIDKPIETTGYVSKRRFELSDRAREIIIKNLIATPQILV